MKNLSGGPSQEYFADGITEELIGRLSSIHDLRVISRTLVMQFKDSHFSVPEIARTLRVDPIVEGSIKRITRFSPQTKIQRASKAAVVAHVD